MFIMSEENDSVADQVADVCTRRRYRRSKMVIKEPSMITRCATIDYDAGT